MTPVTRFFILSNNIVIIAKSIGFEDGYELQDPYMVYHNQGQVMLTPYLQDVIGQKAETIEIKNKDILTITPAETKNDILQSYLKQISGIETGGELILG